MKIATTQIKEDWHDRRLWIDPPRGWRGRTARWLLGCLESRIAAWSIHGDRPVYDRETFDWIDAAEARWEWVREEVSVVLENRESVPRFQDVFAGFVGIQNDDDWRTHFLIAMGRAVEPNAGRCPETMRLIHEIPGVRNAFFSILAPHKHIPPHRGPYNGLLRFHLALVVPEPRERCRIRIANEVHSWTEGDALVFDDTFRHAVWNDTDGIRVVLFIDFERPLRAPYHWLNARILDVISRAPPLTRARRRLERRERCHAQGGSPVVRSERGVQR